MMFPETIWYHWYEHTVLYLSCVNIIINVSIFSRDPFLFIMFFSVIIFQAGDTENIFFQYKYYI